MLRREVDEVLAVDQSARLCRFGLRLTLVGALTTALRRVSPGVTAAVGIGAQSRTFAVFRFFDRLFALLYLRGKARLRRLLRVRGGLLGAINLGRVLRGGQVGQLQIRGTNRHARLFHL